MQYKNLPEGTKTYMELIVLNDERAYIDVVVELPDVKYKTRHVSGPRFDVEDYFNGVITMEQLQDRWRTN